jgi:hypothetical protein
MKKVIKKAPRNKKPVKNKSKSSNSISSLIKKISQNKKAYDAAKAKVIKQGDKLFKDSIRAIFKEFPKLNSFSWNEYAPHWNDGDECVFSVYFETLSINDEENPESLWELERLNKLLSNKEKEKLRIEKEIELLNKQKKKDENWKINSLKDELRDIEQRDPKEVAEKYRIKKVIIELLEGIETEVYQDMFGEGTVVARRDGITVEECEHD